MTADSVSRRTLLAGLGAWAAAGCSRLAFVAANVPAAFGHHRRHADLAYGTDPQHRVDVYVPEGAAAARPLVVFWHGGRWSFGDKDHYAVLGEALASLGYIARLANN